MNNTEYIRQMKERVATFSQNQDQESFQDILSLIFNGIRENCSISVAYVVDIKNHDGYIYCKRDYQSGYETAFAFTDEADLRKKGTISLTLRAVLDEIMSNGACNGLFINPNDENVFISKNLLKTALDAGYALAKEEIEQEAEMRARQDKEHELICKRTLSDRKFAEIAERIKAFDSNTDDFLKISFLNEKSTLFAQVLRDADGRHLSFGIDMSAFSWDEPLVLGKSFPTEEAIEMLRRVCVDGENPNTMEEVEDFRSEEFH